jgi:hypothetical protein
MMDRILLLCSFLFLFFLAGCGEKALPPVSFVKPAQTIDYLHEVRPVLVKRCVVCHSCYNSPCQLKLSSFEGLDRGASKKAVYNAERLKTMEPTRLFVDAQTTEEWREKDFHSVTENSAEGDQNNSILMQFIAHKKDNPIQDKDEFYPEADDLTCAKSDKELGAYLNKHPNRGMPFGFPPLTENEFNIIAGWLSQGAKGPDDVQQAKIEAIPEFDQAKIAQWEAFFNNQDAKYAMTARYLYEHLFLAHIKFDTPENLFYELVRSRTPPGEKIDVIATDLPYDDPQVDKIYYRLRKIHSTIVHKTHMVFEFSEKQYQRFHELFIEPSWLLSPNRVGYDKRLSANPFRAFEQIPPRSRYQFLLDNIHYIIMTFIRGPVCKGQVALNVVRDQFWLVFLDPDYDLSVQNPGFLQTYGSLLEMPQEEKSDWLLAETIFSKKYRKKSSQFVKERRDYYSTHYRYDEPGYDAIWRGVKDTDAPLLTVFRHFDSASVHKGALGNLPRTIWLMDYPLVERIYYSLVAGFNVYGTAMHQLTTRIYMDELRQEGETYFLDFMPKDRRKSMMKEWYGGMKIDNGKIIYSPSDLEAGVSFQTTDPKREFMEHLVGKHFLSEISIAFDKNYLSEGEDYPPLPEDYATLNDYIQGFRAVSKPGVSFFTKVHGHNANLAYVRIKVNDKIEEDVYISMIINRWHDNVTTLFGEKNMLRPEKDSGVFIEGFVGSYPNYFFEVNLADLPDFLQVLDDFDGQANSIDRLNKYGVNRADDRFWQVYDQFQDRFNSTKPVQAGLFDLNRYYHLALTQGEDDVSASLESK